jgi:hypothetical protein
LRPFILGRAARDEKDGAADKPWEGQASDDHKCSLRA